MKPKRIAVAAALASALGAWLYWRPQINASLLERVVEQLETWQDAQPLLTFLLVLAAYTVLALAPIAPGKSMLCGWLFGFLPGLMLVSCGSTLAAVGSFCASRYLFRDQLQARYGDRLQRLNRLLEREGPFVLFSLRLIPGVPFTPLNLLMGLTPVRTRTFWWISQAAMLPANFACAYVGSNLPDFEAILEQGPRVLVSPELIAGFLAMAVLPLLLRLAVRFSTRSSTACAEFAEGT